MGWLSPSDADYGGGGEARAYGSFKTKIIVGLTSQKILTNKISLVSMILCVYINHYGVDTIMKVETNLLFPAPPLILHIAHACKGDRWSWSYIVWSYDVIIINEDLLL